MTAQNLTPAQIWDRTVDIIKDRVNHRSLWFVMEKAVGLAIDDDTFIVGLDARFQNEAGHMNVSEHRNAIDKTVSWLLGRPMKVRIIEGSTLEDWAATKKADARIAAMRNATFARREQKAETSESWDAMFDYVSRSYNAATQRQLPQGKARYLSDMLYALAEAMDTLYPEPADDISERMLGRCLDRIGTNAEVPPTLVALELERLRAWRRQNPG